MAAIQASVTNQQIGVTVGESQIDVTVSGGVGPSGAAGAAGQAASVTVGTVTTGAAGSQASVTNVGTSSAAVLNFTIPAGATGSQGATGPAGTTTWAGITDKPSFAAVATSGAYSDLTGTPAAYNLPAATGSVLGGVKIGSGISIDGNGVISASSGYTLPVATGSVLGGVKIGSGVTITDGVISVATNYAAASHGHAIADVTGLQAALDGKQASGSYAAAVHTHGISDVTGLQAALDGKAAALHAHTVSDITATGTPSASTFLRGDGSWATPSGGAVSVRSDTVGSTSYIGRASAGSATSASVWTIRRTILTSAGAVSSTATATNVAWDNRLTATYS